MLHLGRGKKGAVHVLTTESQRNFNIYYVLNLNKKCSSSSGIYEAPSIRKQDRIARDLTFKQTCKKTGQWCQAAPGFQFQIETEFG